MLTTGAGGGDDREVIVLSDQNFPAALPASNSGKKCIAVLRIEFGSLSELTEMFLKYRTMWLSDQDSNVSKVQNHVAIRPGQ